MSSADGQEIALNPVSYVVLGQVAAMGRSTPYEMKQKVALSIGYFWTFPHSQLYAEPARLAAAGLLHEEVEPEGRRRRFYTIRPEGIAALRRWLAEPDADHAELRDPGLLKLFMAQAADPADIARLAVAQREVHGGRLAVYRAIREAVGGVADGWELRTLTFGERYEELCVQFWLEVERDAGSDAPHD